MKISNLQLQAFYQCAQTLNVSVAAEKMGLTQSALSQRLSSLENDLEASLFIRDSKGLILTPEGEKLLRYAESAVGLEKEFLKGFRGESFGGVLRIAGYSSVMRSMIQPKCATFLRQNQDVTLDFQIREMRELPLMLSSSRTDFIILDHSLGRKGVLETHLADEEYVLIDSAKYKTPETYLDHDPDDGLTYDFLKHQGIKDTFKRSYLSDVYGLIQGVEEGLGKAVMSRHLVEGNKKIKIIKSQKRYLRPIILHYYERPYYTELHKSFFGQALNIN